MTSTSIADASGKSALDTVGAVWPFETEDLSPFIGTLVSGIDLKQPQPASIRNALRHLLWQRGVIFPPHQHLSPVQQIKATELFGTAKIPDEYREGSPLPGIGVIDGDNLIGGRVSRWHADLTSSTLPPTVRLLQAKLLPAKGGDTLWASTEAAYYSLAEPLRRLADQLSAIHALTPIRYTHIDERRTNFKWAEHPVVRVHPVTGRRSLFVNPRFTQEITGLRPHESAAVLRAFYEHITLPEHQVRFSWRVGSLAIWDNRTTVHYASDDYGDERRIIHTSDIEPEAVIGLKDIGEH